VSLEALIGGLVQGQIEAWEAWPRAIATPNRRIMYAALNWCQEHHTGSSTRCARCSAAIR
jgi:4-hydroxyphenylacetate 3-monooxygenase